jgi:ribosomal protein S18 acetylase RimI-like enzyme
MTEIRVLTANDAQIFKDHWLPGLLEHPEAFGVSHEEFEMLSADDIAARFFANPNFVLWGAFQAGKLVGFVGTSRDPRPKLRHRQGIGPMYVAPEARGRGVGRALMEWVIERGRTEGVEQLRLSVTVGNEPAERLYRACGFESYGIEKAGLKTGGKAYDLKLMVLFLDTGVVQEDKA